MPNSWYFPTIRHNTVNEDRLSNLFRFGSYEIGISNRRDGDMREQSRFADFMTRKGIDPRQSIRMHQVHGATVRCVDANHKGTTVPQTDGMMYVQTSLTEPSAVLCIYSADCLPVFLIDSNRGVFAAVHAGWRGILSSIVTNAIRQMVKYGSVLSQIQIVVGPHIRSCCYTVDQKRETLFMKTFPSSVKKIKNLTSLSLIDALYEDLEKTGIHRSAVFDTGFCTYCLPDQYFSYRHDTQQLRGMMVSYIRKIV